MATLAAAAIIIMEGTHDCHFMRQYLGHLGFGSLLFGGELKDPNRVGKIIVRETKKDGGGIGALIKKDALTSDVMEMCAASDNILIVADANADFKRRRDKLQTTARKITEQTKAKANIFLLPDNEGKGELEDLLEAISADHTVYECLKQYEECLRTKNSELNNKLDMKAKIYAYCDARGISTDWREHNYCDKAHWDLDNPKLAGLQNFLRHNLPSQPRG